MARGLLSRRSSVTPPFSTSPSSPPTSSPPARSPAHLIYLFGARVADIAGVVQQLEGKSLSCGHRARLRELTEKLGTTLWPEVEPAHEDKLEAQTQNASAASQASVGDAGAEGSTSPLEWNAPSARQQQSTRETTPAARWDAAARRWRDASGRFVPGSPPASPPCDAAILARLEALERKVAAPAVATAPEPAGTLLKHVEIPRGAPEACYTYELLFGPYFAGVEWVHMHEPYLEKPHQINNLRRWLELAAARAPILTHVEVHTSGTARAQEPALRRLVMNFAGRFSININFEARAHERKILFSTGVLFRAEFGLDLYVRRDKRSGLRGCKKSAFDVLSLPTHTPRPAPKFEFEAPQALPRPAPPQQPFAPPPAPTLRNTRQRTRLRPSERTPMRPPTFTLATPAKYAPLSDGTDADSDPTPAKVWQDRELANQQHQAQLRSRAATAVQRWWRGHQENSRRRGELLVRMSNGLVSLISNEDKNFSECYSCYAEWRQRVYGGDDPRWDMSPDEELSDYELAARMLQEHATAARWEAKGTDFCDECAFIISVLFRGFSCSRFCECVFCVGLPQCIMQALFDSFSVLYAAEIDEKLDLTFNDIFDVSSFCAKKGLGFPPETWPF